jgi:hypothetical protein
MAEPEVRPPVLDVPIDKLAPAKWNYKTDGTPEQIEQLGRSIQEDASAGVMAVRELDGNGTLEVIDGNHRLYALRELGWSTVRVENFGGISLAKAVTIARRRNYQWFEDDPLKLGSLLKNVVVPEIPIAELAEYMPETREEIEHMIETVEFPWDKLGDEGGRKDKGDVYEIKIVVTPEIKEKWEEWRQRCTELLGYDSDMKCLELAVAEALNVPVESLQ